MSSNKKPKQKNTKNNLDNLKGDKSKKKSESSIGQSSIEILDEPNNIISQQPDAQEITIKTSEQTENEINNDNNDIKKTISEENISLDNMIGLTKPNNQPVKNLSFNKTVEYLGTNQNQFLNYSNPPINNRSSLQIDNLQDALNNNNNNNNNMIKSNGGNDGGGGDEPDEGKANAPQEWDDDFEKICANLIDESQINTVLHQKSHRYYTKWSRRFQIPIIVLSAFAGSGNFVSSTFEEYERHIIIGIGAISILTSILSSIAQYLQLAELKEGHRISSFHWENFFNELKVQLMLKRKSRKELPEFYNQLLIEYRRLKEISPIFKKKISKSIRTKSGYEYMNVPFYLNGFSPIVPYEKSLEDYQYYYQINNRENWYNSPMNKRNRYHKKKNKKRNSKYDYDYDNNNSNYNNNNKLNVQEINDDKYKTIRGRSDNTRITIDDNLTNSNFLQDRRSTKHNLTI
tara:strand:- start:50 stop:1426 length:1377 start_codon:yes stop_codon:yes gene_type:complete